MSDETKVQIRITEDGPYRVSGVPLSRTAPIETRFGDRVAWEADEPLEAGSRYSLCRCGGSSNKPFCDDSHLTNGFDGTEVADRATRASRMRVFEGDEVTMTDDPSFCTHAAFCQSRESHVWEMIAQTGDPEVRERLIRMVSHCPSGRLAYAASPDADEIEPPFEPSIAVIRDGPLWVRGGVDVVGADGVAYETRNRVTLCRCGHSRNKPFCDGSHDEVGFRDPERDVEPEPVTADPGTTTP